MALKEDVLSKVFFSRGKGRLKNFLTFLGILPGMVLVLVAVHFYTPLQEMMGRKDSSYLLLNKAVGVTDALMNDRVRLQRSEVDSLSKHTFFEKVVPVRSNAFRVEAHVGGKVGVSTELFLEAIPKGMLDDPPDNWRWYPGRNTVPVIISRDFLNLYNFGFALSRGLPKLSPETVQMLPLQLRLKGSEDSKVFQASIVGFSDRVPSVLVPVDFLNWANENIGGEKESPAGRVLVKVKDGEQKAFEHFLKNSNYRVNKHQQEYQKLVSYLKAGIGVALVLGLLFIILAMAFMTSQYSYQIASRHFEIGLLIQLGYRSGDLFMFLMRRIIAFLGITLLVSLVIYALFRWGIEWGYIPVGFAGDPSGWGVILSVILIFYGVSILTTGVLIKRVLNNFKG